MDAHPTLLPGNKSQPVKSKFRKISEAPKQNTKEVVPQMHRRTFGVIRDPNVPEKTLPRKLKPKPSNPISLKQSKPTPESAPVPKPESAKKIVRKKKTEKIEGSATKKSPAREGEGVKTPVRPPFSVKPVKVPGTPYLSAEKCSSCRFDRLETSSYWLGQIKSAEAVGKHFVSAAFFRLAHECKAEPARNLHVELKKYLARHDGLSSDAEWEHVCGIYGLAKTEQETKGNEEAMNVLHHETNPPTSSKHGDVQEQEE